MRSAAAFWSLGSIDARNVARDPMLRWIAVLTPGLGLLVRFVVPAITDALSGRFGFDLEVYYPLVTSFMPLVAAGMVGTVTGFLLLDQRDDQTMTALLVTPLTLGDYLRYRFSMLIAVCIVFSVAIVPLAGLIQTSLLQTLVASMSAALLAPIYALFLGTFAANKVQGFALAKALGIVFVPCIASYFVPQPWQSAFGLVPHYWPLKVFWLFHQGANSAALAHALAGIAWQVALLMILVRQFSRVVRR